MMNRYFTGILLIVAFLTISGCSRKNKELEKDTNIIAETMCRSIELMNRLKAADPGNVALVDSLQAQEHKMQAEMDSVYKKFREKYKKELNNPDFSKEFSASLRESMLECKYLSKQDRENFEREVGN